MYKCKISVYKFYAPQNRGKFKFVGLSVDGSLGWRVTELKFRSAIGTFVGGSLKLILNYISCICVCVLYVYAEN